MLYRHYGKRAFVIVDEYDVPMAKALGTPVYDKVWDMVEHMLSFVCKTNENVKAVMLSGCLYTVKNSTLETGYLTKAVAERTPRMPLRIPNREIREVFRREVWYYFKDRVDNLETASLRWIYSL